jgi:acyl-CoA thioesterase-1
MALKELCILPGGLARHQLCDSPGMRFLGTLLLGTVAAVGCTGDGISATSPGRVMPVIVAFGDSLTSGPGLKPEQRYPELLQQRLTAEDYSYRIVNAGVSGDTTTEALERFDRALVADTKILILAIGINDGLRGVPAATVERNIASMIERARARGVAVLLCAMEAPPVNGLSYTIEFHRMYARLAERYNVPLVPFFLIGIVGNDELNLDDTLHPNAAGHKVIANAIWPYLRPLL